LRGPVSIARRRAGRLAKAVARRLPPPRDQALLGLLWYARALVTGRGGAAPGAERRPGSLVEAPPLPPVAPLPKDMVWQLPPEVVGSGRAIRSLYDTGGAAEVYDVELLEKLNAEYADRPIVASPPVYDAVSLEASARRRVGWVHDMVDLRNKTTLEIGCGNGFEVWSLAHNLGCDAFGVDVTEYGPWQALAGDRVHFTCADISTAHPFLPNTFDRVLSFTVWEHVLHPYAMLRETYDILKPGGLAWIRANLFAGPQASHRYRDIYFPWPHLLFSDDVIREWDAKNGRQPRGSAWVNRLSWDHYERYFAEIGFRVRSLSFTTIPFDEEFYKRFEDVLGRYPRKDLERDFFLAVLEKPGS
jgi:SAM-dependent methyltransferase